MHHLLIIGLDEERIKMRKAVEIIIFMLLIMNSVFCFFVAMIVFALGDNLRALLFFAGSMLSIASTIFIKN